MSRIDRRTLLGAAGLALAATGVKAAPEVTDARAAPEGPGGAAPEGPGGAAPEGPGGAAPKGQGGAAPAASTPAADVTRTLARYVAEARYEDLPEAVRREGTRTFLNWVGVAIGGSHHETLDVAVSALAPFSGPPQAGLFGRPERFDIMNAAFLTGCRATSSTTTTRT